MNNIEFEGVISKGHLEPHIRLSIANVMSSMESKRIRVTIGEAKKKRSLKQNKFWFGMCVPQVRHFMRENGQNLTLDETHDMCVRLIWKRTKYVEMPNGTHTEVRCSSTDETTFSWEEAIDQTRAYFAPMGLMLPMPNEILPV